MNNTVEDALAVNYATLTRLVDAPTGALGFGTDLSCVTDVTPTLAEVDPASPIGIVQSSIRRLTTPRGALIDDASYGLDVRSVLHRGATPRDLRAITGAIRGETQKDDRVASAAVQLTAALRSNSLLVAMQITPEDPTLHDFDFTFSVTDGEVLMGTISNG